MAIDRKFSVAHAFITAVMQDYGNEQSAAYDDLIVLSEKYNINPDFLFSTFVKAASTHAILKLQLQNAALTNARYVGLTFTIAEAMATIYAQIPEIDARQWIPKRSQNDTALAAAFLSDSRPALAALYAG